MPFWQRLRNGLLQVGLRIRYAEYVGTRLTPYGARYHLALVSGGAAAVCLFGGFFVRSLATRDVLGSLLGGGLVLLLGFCVVNGLRLLRGYYQSERYPIVLDLWSDSGPQPWTEGENSPVKRAVLWSEPEPEPAKLPLFERVESAFMLTLFWFLAVLMWIIAVAVLYGLISGDIHQGATPATSQ